MVKLIEFQNQLHFEVTAEEAQIALTARIHIQMERRMKVWELTQKSNGASSDLERAAAGASKEFEQYSVDPINITYANDLESYQKKLALADHALSWNADLTKQEQRRKQNKLDQLAKEKAQMDEESQKKIGEIAGVMRGADLPDPLELAKTHNPGLGK